MWSPITARVAHVLSTFTFTIISPFNFSLAAAAAMSVEFYLSIYRAGKWSMKVESRKCMKVESLRLVHEQHTLQLERERLMQCVSHGDHRSIYESES